MAKLLTAQDISRALQKHATPARASASARFFKTGPGQYGEGDVFVGATMPEQRIIAKEFSGLPKPEIIKLLHSKIHEERMVALLVIVHNFQTADQKGKTTWFQVFWTERKYINSWDLVDVTVPKVVGEYFLNKSRAPLYKLIKSKSIWERRIAILATLTFIRHNDFTDTLKMAQLLLNDTHDLMHKATGWMLREVGKRSRKKLQKFLQKNHAKMPRTMLRYAIEHFPGSVRGQYLKGTK